MRKTDHLVVVTSKQFWDYIKKHPELKKEQGDWFHSDFWYNEKGESVAYMETSSWGAPDVYMLTTGGMPQCNVETINIVTSLFNKKQR